MTLLRPGNETVKDSTSSCMAEEVLPVSVVDGPFKANR